MKNIQPMTNEEQEGTGAHSGVITSEQYVAGYMSLVLRRERARIAGILEGAGMKEIADKILDQSQDTELFYLRPKQTKKANPAAPSTG